MPGVGDDGRGGRAGEAVDGDDDALAELYVALSSSVNSCLSLNITRAKHR